mmetsp:Transcript_5849/g.19378  ORF Transcript_5849/g.19378 Transcript_5849/m.19378 type:complete len:283 (+) Transcript_5849:1849-2697(+)
MAASGWLEVFLPVRDASSLPPSAAYSLPPTEAACTDFPAICTNSRNHVTAVTRVNSSLARVCTSRVCDRDAKSHTEADVPFSLPSPTPTSSCLISTRNVRSAPSACCRISRFGSLSICITPWKNRGNTESASISGIWSIAAIQPSKNCRRYGSARPFPSVPSSPANRLEIAAPNNSVKVTPSTESAVPSFPSSAPTSETTSFVSRSRRCAAFCTSASASALRSHRLSKIWSNTDALASVVSALLSVRNSELSVDDDSSDIVKDISNSGNRKVFTTLYIDSHA